MIFALQIPITATAEDLLPLFAPFAARGLRALNIIKEPDGRSKGCAMVLFERWAEGKIGISLGREAQITTGGRLGLLYASYGSIYDDPSVASSVGTPYL